MSGNPEDKPFKTLKLTSLKAAKPAEGAPKAPEIPSEPSAPPVSGAREVRPAPAPDSPSFPVSSPVPAFTAPPASSPAPAPSRASAEPEKSKPGAPPEVPATPQGSGAPFRAGSLNMMSLKIGGAPKESSADSPPAASTPPPALSPSAATSSPILKPFKVNTNVPKQEPSSPAASSVPAPETSKPQELKLTRSSTSTPFGYAGKGPEETRPQPDSPPAPASVAPAPVSPAPVSKKAVPAELPGKPEKAPVAKPPAKAVLLIVGVVIFLGLGIAGSLIMSKSEQPKAVEIKKPAEVVPAVDPVKPVQAGNSGVPSGRTPGTETPATGETVAAIKPPAPDRNATAPRTRRPALEQWLRESTVTTVASHRITMNDKVYLFGAAVNPEGTLKWIGRDSQTRDLIFIDDAGVIYTRPAGGTQ